MLSLPVAAFFAGDVALCFGEKDVPGSDLIIGASFLVAWASVIYWAPRESPSVREAAARTCSAFALAALLLPAAAIVLAITEPPHQDPIFPVEFIVGACFLFGGVMALLGWIASNILSPY